MVRPAWVGPILGVVVTTPHLVGSIAAYENGLGLRVRRRGRVSKATAAGWAAPLLAGAACATVGPESGVGGDIQLVQAPPAPGYAPLRRYGWAALELSVADLDVAVDRLGDDFTVIGRPASLSGPAAALRAAQILGPAGEVIYLTELRRPLPPFRLPAPASGPDPDGVFVAVLAASDLPASRAWWEQFPVRRCTDRQATIEVLNRAHGRPAGSTSRISSLQLSGHAVVEIDQYPAGLPRPPTTGGLPPGVACVALGVPYPGATATGGRLVTHGPDGELIELVPVSRPIDVL